MSSSTAQTSQVQLDLSDVDGRVGQLVGGGQLWDPCSSSDIRRWVMAMDYPNPIHWDEEFARKSKFGGLVAPQSFAVALDYRPWLPAGLRRQHPGLAPDLRRRGMVVLRPAHPARATSCSRSAASTATRSRTPSSPARRCSQRGDTIHRNQHGALVAKERSTAIRYLAAEAEKRGMYANQLPPKPKWTREQLAEIDKIRHDWILSNRLGISPRFDDVKVGDKLPRRVIGPHSHRHVRHRIPRLRVQRLGHLCAGSRPRASRIRGSIRIRAGSKDSASTRKARRSTRASATASTSARRAVTSTTSNAGEIGMARAYGYGATMGAWVTDYLAYWAGNDGFVRHAKS